MDYLNYGKSDTTKLKRPPIPKSLKDHATILYHTPLWHMAAPLPERAYEWALWYREKYKDEGVKISNRGGFQSPSRAWSDFEFRDHVDSILGQFKEYRNFYIANWWLNVNEKGDRNQKHVHSGSDFSAVWYITNNEGLLVFEDPLTFSRLRSMKSVFGSTTLQQVNALAGDLLFFPSDLPHFVEEHTLDTPRISVSFNITVAYDCLED